MVDNPIDLLVKTQQAALGLAADTLRLVRDTAVTGVTNPEELLSQVAALSTAVTGLASAITGLAGATAQPLQDFIVRQRELADTVATLAEAQSELSAVVAKLAERHADTVSALEKLSAPVFAVVGTQPTPARRDRAKASAQKAAGKASKAATKAAKVTDEA